MRFGLAPVQSAANFEAMIDQSKLAESLGYDALWVHEHHSQEMIYPSPLLSAAVLAARTTRIAIGTNMLLLPLYHPLRVAEDAAMVDVLSGGRFILGVAAGYAKNEFEAFGARLSERGRRMTEGLELIRAAWTQSPLRFEGSDFRLENFSLLPSPFSSRRLRSMWAQGRPWRFAERLDSETD